MRRHGDVLFLTTRIAKPKRHETRFTVLNEFKRIADRHVYSCLAKRVCAATPITRNSRHFLTIPGSVLANLANNETISRFVIITVCVVGFVHGLSGTDFSAPAILGPAGLCCSAATGYSGGRWHLSPRHLSFRHWPGAMAGGLCTAIAAADRRPLRR